jgi:hypothetical protein
MDFFLKYSENILKIWKKAKTRPDWIGNCLRILFHTHYKIMNNFTLFPSFPEQFDYEQLPEVLGNVSRYCGKFKISRYCRNVSVLLGNSSWLSNPFRTVNVFICDKLGFGYYRPSLSAQNYLVINIFHR